MRCRFLCLVFLVSFARLFAQSGALYSIDGTAGGPTDEETLHLELINRARMDPVGEATRLRTTTDADVLSAVAFFNTNLTVMAQEISALPAVPPVAFNARLIDAARSHSLDQFTNQFQGHTGSNQSTSSSRVLAAGYSYQTTGENVFSYARTVFEGHAGFEIDWGPGDNTGMQPGRGHRVNIHSSNYREIGVGVVLGTNGSVGPQVVTQNFGTQFNAGPLLTGVAYYDLSGDDFYSLGEGLGGITVSVTGGNFHAQTSASGAFTVPLPGAGTYSVRFSGLGFDETTSVTSAGGANVKANFKRSYVAPSLSGPLTGAVGAAASYGTTAVAGATRYELVSYRRGSGTPVELAENTLAATLSVTAGYNVVQSAIRAEGSSAFNLRTVDGQDDQYLTLDRLFFGRPGASLSFASRLAAATTNETARVQVSTDEGVTWTDVFAQTGNGSPGETTFTSRTVSLAALEGKTFRVRLAYVFTTGSFFNSGTVGWYIDNLQFANCEELTAETRRDLGAATGFSYTPTAAGNYLLKVVNYNFNRQLGATAPLLLSAANTPVVTRQPAAQSPSVGSSATFTVESSNALTHQWQRNGTNIAGGTSASLTVNGTQPADTGLYSAIVTNASGSTTTEPAILGVSTTAKLEGAGSEVGSNIVHPNGNVFDQILLQGQAATFRADYDPDPAKNQITRLSFVDLTDDIVQVEFSGPGTVSIVLEGSSGPALPANYNQSTLYMKGHAGIVVTGANESTHLSVFSVGRGTAVNQALFKDAVDYDGMADISFIAIQSTNGKFGGLRAANASFWNTKGFTGVYAPGVQFTGPVYVHDINAQATAAPLLMLGSALGNTWITGGDLLQANGAAVKVSGVTQLKMADGVTSHYVASAPVASEYLLAKTNQGRLEQSGVDVTAQIVLNPAP